MKITQLQNGIAIAQQEQGPSIQLPLNSVGYNNLAPATQMMFPPVGATMSAFLTEAQFQSQMGTGWVLCDGRTVSGSSYATITGNTAVPDVRSTVLRGKDNGRGLNPDGDLPLGTYQPDAFYSHNHVDYGHTHVQTITNNSGGAVFSGSLTPTFSGTATLGPVNSTEPASANIAYNGGDETRGKSVTVNIFIRIN
jgi:hypothetical protein